MLRAPYRLLIERQSVAETGVAETGVAETGVVVSLILFFRFLFFLFRLIRDLKMFRNFTKIYCKFHLLPLAVVLPTLHRRLQIPFLKV